MNTETKVIKTKAGLLQLTEQLGNVPKHASYSAAAGTAFTDSKIFTVREENLLSVS